MFILFIRLDAYNTYHLQNNSNIHNIYTVKMYVYGPTGKWVRIPHYSDRAVS